VALVQVQYEAPGWGVGELWVEGGTVVWHELPAPKPSAVPPPLAVPGTLEGGRGFVTEYARRLAERLQAYFAGEPDDFRDVEIELDGATPFQRSLTAALRAIPRGEVVAYGELAALAGRPSAARAAGTFCARNQLPIVVPCHRVVAADGLGSYGSLGLSYKRRLLELEGAAF
jgi:methylated-DNA-[protein]-cysteine S-methyltransferase